MDALAAIDVVEDLRQGVWPLLALDLVGVFAFSLSGGLAAVRRDFDLFGVLVLALVAGLGGGILRDVLVGAVPPVGVSDWRLVATACAAGFATFVWHPGVARIRRVVLLLDAAGLGLFAVAGTYKALELGTTPLAAVIVGTLTGVGGGILRDLLTGSVPEVLRQGELYATPALLGATVFAALWTADVVHPAITVGCVLGVAGVRVWALRYRIRVPRAPGGGRAAAG